MADENTNTAETAASTNAPETGVNAQPKDTATSPVAANTASQKNGADDLSEELGMWKHQPVRTSRRCMRIVIVPMPPKQACRHGRPSR